MTRSILVGVDGSAESKAAAEYAARLAQATHSGLEFAHVLPEINDPDLGGLVERTQAARTERAHILLHQMSQTVPRPNTAVESSLLEGSPALRLAEEAKRPDIWLVVVGHRGRGSLERVLLGSVADRLVQISPKPVIVVR
jgi:nucleotide-binding universal stress UspA family protein